MQVHFGSLSVEHQLREFECLQRDASIAIDGVALLELRRDRIALIARAVANGEHHAGPGAGASETALNPTDYALAKEAQMRTRGLDQPVEECVKAPAGGSKNGTCSKTLCADAMTAWISAVPPPTR